jgi:hypothetical protein
MTRSLRLSHTAARSDRNYVRRMMGWRNAADGRAALVLGRSLRRLMPAEAASPAMRLMLAMFREVMNHHLTRADF